jgi:hypothetical protein
MFSSSSSRPGLISWNTITLQTVNPSVATYRLVYHLEADVDLQGVRERKSTSVPTSLELTPRGCLDEDLESCQVTWPRGVLNPRNQLQARWDKDARTPDHRCSHFHVRVHFARCLLKFVSYNNNCITRQELS